MVLSKALFTSTSNNYETPQGLFEQLNNIYKFDLDAAATHENTKCKKWLGPGGLVEDSLTVNWEDFGKSIWLNPPYDSKLQDRFVQKAYETSLKGATVVLLLPSRTDTKRFHNWILPFGKIEWVKGRLKFNNVKDPAPFPSMIVTFEAKVT